MKKICCLLIVALMAALVTPTMGHAEAGKVPLKFDNDGSIVLTTIDKKATSSVRYKTVGWTLFNATRTKSVVLPFEAYNSVDLGDGNVKTFFRTEADVVLNRIGEVDPMWQRDLYTNGGDLYFDSVMTINNKGTVLGGLLDNGRKSWGEIYYTLSGIQGARSWADPGGLVSHFNILVHLPPHPELLKGMVMVKHFETDGTPLAQYDYTEYLTPGTNYIYTPTAVIGHANLGYNTGFDALPSGPMKAPGEVKWTYDGAFTNAYVYFYYDTSVVAATNSNLNPNASGFIKADNRGSEKFDVSKGIPSSEKMYVNLFGKNYLYNYNFLENTGSKNYTVTVKKTYNLSWTEDRGKYVWVTWVDENGVRHREREWVENWVTRTAASTVSKDYAVPREFSYWTIPLLEVYGIEKAVVNNTALPSGSVTLTPQGYSFPNMDVWHSDVVTDHVEYPPVADAFTITLASESILGGGSRPSVPDEDWSANADAAVGQIQVKNDRLVFNSTTVMSDAEVSKNTLDPGNIPANQNIGANVLYQDALQIDALTKNQVYASTGSFFYKLHEKSITTNTAGINSPLTVNSVKVHTPVVCNASIWNDAEFNQEITPDGTRAALVLDRPSKIQLTTSGKHLSIPGYGDKDYKLYTRDKEVKFPFDVYIDTTFQEASKYLKANTWYSVDLNDSILDIYIPPWVDEGDYTVEYRATPINADAADMGKTEDKANLSLNNYIATKNISVKVIGRIFGFKVTDITDSLWNKVFRINDKSAAHSPNYFWVGTQNENGESTTVDPKFTLPILTGSNPLFKNIGAIKTGYKFKFELQTVGSYFGAFDGVSIKPSFRYVSTSGTNAMPVDLYYNERFNGKENYFVKIESGSTSRNRLNVKYTKLGDPFRNVPITEMTETSRIQSIVQNQFVSQDTKLGWFDWVYLSSGLRTFVGDSTSLPVGVNKDRAIQAKQKWYGEYYLPNEVFACRVGTDVAEFGRTNNGIDAKSSIWLKKGYIVVNFDIETIQNKDFANPALSYYKSPNCNMWNTEGFKNSKVDGNSIGFTLNDGDVAFYFTDRKASDDYQDGGTH